MRKVEKAAPEFLLRGYFNTKYFSDPKEKIIGIIMKQTQVAKDETHWKFQILAEQSTDA